MFLGESAIKALKGSIILMLMVQKVLFDIPNLNNLETTQDAMIQSLEKSIEQIKS